MQHISGDSWLKLSEIFEPGGREQSEVKLVQREYDSSTWVVLSAFQGAPAMNVMKVQGTWIFGRLN